MIYAERPGSNLVSSAEVTDPWAKDYSCPDCTHETHFVKAHLRNVGSTQVYVMAHFRHNPSSEAAGPDHNTAECSVAEHTEHERMRIIAFEMLKSRCANGSTKVPDDFPTYTDADMDTGPQGGTKTKTIGGRHPDAYIEFGDADPRYGNGIVLEVQYRHTNKPIKQVTRNYLDARYSVLWTRPKDYADTGHAVELGNIITLDLDYPFIDEYRAEEWSDLFKAERAADLAETLTAPTASFAPLLEGAHPQPAVVPLAWPSLTAEDSNEGAENSPAEIEGLSETRSSDIPFEVSFLPYDERGQCDACEESSVQRVRWTGKRAEGLTTEFCEECADYIVRRIVRAAGVVQYDDLIGMIERFQSEDLAMIHRISHISIHYINSNEREGDLHEAWVTDSGILRPKNVIKLSEKDFDDPSHRLRYEKNFDEGTLHIHIPREVADGLDPVGHELRGSAYYLSDGYWEIKDIRNSELTGLKTTKLVVEKTNNPNSR